MTIWGVLMLISRVRLGMHYPIDLLIAIISAWVVHVIIFSFLQRKNIFSTQTKKGGEKLNRQTFSLC